MKKTPRVDRYDPIIYPRKLWVTGDVIGLNKIFKFNKLDNTKRNVHQLMMNLQKNITLLKMDGLLVL